MKWTLSILLSFFVLTGCVGLSTKSMPEEAKILVVSQTSNEYLLTHLSYHFISTFRQAQSTKIDLDWTMTSLFNDVVAKNTVSSRFEFSYLDNSIANFKDDKSLNAELQKLAVEHGADYVLVLKSSVVPNDLNLKFDAGHYGYVQESMRGITDIGRVYANVHVRLLDAKTLDSKLFKYRSCGRIEPSVFTFEQTQAPLTLPENLKNLSLTNLLVADEVAMVAEATKALASAEIEKAIFACKLDR